MSVAKYVTDIGTFAEFELRKLKHDPIQILVRTAQPALWLLVFGPILSGFRIIPTDDLTYLQFMTPGVVAHSALFVSIQYGLSLIRERDVGVLNKILSTPASNSAIVLGKAVSAGLRGILQAVVVVALAAAIGVRFSIEPVALLGMAGVVVLLGMCFASVSMIMAAILRRAERTMGLTHGITTPLFLASNAIYPLSIMPEWLRAIALANPLSYAVEALRALLLTGKLATVPMDFLALVVATIGLVAVATGIFRRILG
jgi:ABC-2 type transport system permease protein